MEHEEFAAYMTDMILVAMDLLEEEVERSGYQEARAMLKAIGINTGDKQ